MQNQKKNIKEDPITLNNKEGTVYGMCLYSKVDTIIPCGHRYCEDYITDIMDDICVCISCNTWIMSQQKYF